MTRRLSASLLLIGIAVRAAAQGKPDFSGEWILAASASVGLSVARGLTIRQRITRTNALGAPIEPFFDELIVVRTFADHTQTDTYQLGVQGGVVGGGPQTRYSVRWEGNRLLIETGTYSRSTARRDRTPSTRKNGSSMLRGCWSCR
jgi:hypothetical protein